MNPNQFMHQTRHLDGLGKCSETFHINIVNILTWSMVSEDHLNDMSNA